MDRVRFIRPGGNPHSFKKSVAVAKQYGIARYDSVGGTGQTAFQYGSRRPCNDREGAPFGGEVDIQSIKHRWRRYVAPH
jgi:hypothetical protein